MALLCLLELLKLRRSFPCELHHCFPWLLQLTISLRTPQAGLPTKEIGHFFLVLYVMRLRDLVMEEMQRKSYAMYAMDRDAASACASEEKSV